MKKKALKMTLTGHFQSFFFPSPDPKSEKISHKSTNKKKSGPIPNTEKKPHMGVTTLKYKT